MIPATLTVEHHAEYVPRMTTIQVVLEDSLLQAADRAVRRLKVNRSALIRDALREHLRRLSLHEQERRDREGYARHGEELERDWELARGRRPLRSIAPLA